MHSRKHTFGFSLIELLIAGAVFSMVFLGTSMVFVNALRAQRESLADIRVIDNTRSAIESMARTIRTVNEYDILDPPAVPEADANDTTGTRSSISFIHNGKVGGLGCPTAPCEITYLLDPISNRLYEVNRTPPGSGAGGPPPVTEEVFPLTAEGVTVQEFDVIVRGRGNCDNEPPRVTLALRIIPTGSPEKILPLTTTVTLRPLEICP